MKSINLSALQYGPWVMLPILAVLLLLAWQIARLYRRRGRQVPSRFPQMPVKMVQVSGWDIRYHISGRGPCVVLLHGIGANLYCWRFLVPLLNKRYTVIALDLPGFGQSSKPKSESYGLDAQAERLRDFLLHQGVKNCLLVGSSMGGNIALWMALRFPDLCRGTVVIAPAGRRRLMSLTGAHWNWAAPPISLLVGKRFLRHAHLRTVTRQDRVEDPMVDETFDTYAGQKDAVRSFMLATEAIRDPRLPSALSGLRRKVLILWGRQDRMVPKNVIDGLQAALPAAETHVHPTGGHHLQEDEPEWITEKIDTFIRELLD